jgi:glutamate synthase (NADPH/NADH) small chain
MGVKIQYNTGIGTDISIQDLERDHDAVVIAIGLQQGRSTRIPGSDHPAVYKAVSLLSMITRGESFFVPENVVVIGGGNVAMDIARSLARQQKQIFGQVGVTVCALEDFDHFLADPEEVTEAREEGIEIIDSRGPKQVLIDDQGYLTGLATLGVISIFDESGRFAPRYNESDEQVHPAGLVVESIGQMSDTSVFGEELIERLEWNRGRLQIDANGRTSEPWLWAAGDMVRGPDVIHAVADGHRVAASIEQYFADSGRGDEHTA